MAHDCINQPACKCIPAAYPVKDMEGKCLALKSMAFIPHIGLEAVLTAAVGIAHMARNAL
jgi:hypothetical protein